MDLIEKLRLALESPLPGEKAHRLMAPYRRPVQDAIAESGKNPRLSSVLNLLYLHQGEWHIVLTKRNEYGGTHSAQVSFPGGKKDPVDTDLIHTSLRETKEEIGIEVPRNNLIGALSPVYIPPSNFLVNPFVAWLPERPSFHPDPREVNYVIEFPVARLLEEDLIKETTLTTGQGLNMKVPYFDIQGEVVWGATAVILSEFRELLK